MLLEKSTKERQTDTRRRYNNHCHKNSSYEQKLTKSRILSLSTNAKEETEIE